MAAFDYGRMQGVAARLMAKFKQGEVTLTRTTIAAGSGDAPWIPGGPSTEVYQLDATAKGVSAELVDGTLIVATDLEVTIGPKAIHTFTDGDPADGAEVVVDLDPADIIALDGKEVTVLRAMRIPPSGTLIVWKVVVRV